MEQKLSETALNPQHVRCLGLGTESRNKLGLTCLEYAPNHADTIVSNHHKVGQRGGLVASLLAALKRS